MFSLFHKYWSRGKSVSRNPVPRGARVDRRVLRPSEEDYEALELKSEDPGHYVSDSLDDPSNRGGPLGAENEMPDGGDSTRGMTKGPASKSPFPPVQKRTGS